MPIEDQKQVSAYDHRCCHQDPVGPQHGRSLTMAGPTGDDRQRGTGGQQRHRPEPDAIRRLDRFLHKPDAEVAAFKCKPGHIERKPAENRDRGDEDRQPGNHANHAIEATGQPSSPFRFHKRPGRREPEPQHQCAGHMDDAEGPSLQRGNVQAIQMKPGIEHGCNGECPILPAG